MLEHKRQRLAIDTTGKYAVVLMSNNILQGMVLHNYAQPFQETIMKDK
ncbi:hypothetical protein U7537_13895 [Lacticaseibacillus rhamnosus]